MRRFLSLMAAGVLSVSPLRAGGEGSTGAPFLKVPVNARATAMAGAFTSVNSDITSIEYNPAGLIGLTRGDISLTYLDYLEDTSFQSVGLGFPIGKKADPDKEGLTPKTVVGGFQFRQFSADDEERSDLGVALGTIDVRDQLYNLAGAFALTDRLSIGAGVKYISQRLADASLSTFAADAGAIWRAPRKITVGASLLNIGPSKAFESEKDPLPTLLRVGASRPFGPVLVALDASQGRDGVTRIAGGAEWLVGKIVRLRGGAFQQTDELAFTAGLGILAAGPMKSVPASSSFRGGAVSRERTQSNQPELAFNERRAADLLDRLGVLANDLTERYARSGGTPAANPLAVVPTHGAGNRMSTALADLLGQQMQQQFPILESARVDKGLRELSLPLNLDDGDAARLGQLIKARAVLVQQLVPTRDAYKLFARIVDVESGQSVAAATATFPQDVFRGGTQKTSLRALTDAPKGDVGGDPNANRVLWGIDYALTSRDEFGLSHTVSLRIMY